MKQLLSIYRRADLGPKAKPIFQALITNASPAWDEDVVLGHLDRLTGDTYSYSVDTVGSAPRVLALKKDQLWVPLAAAIEQDRVRHS